MKSPKCSCRSSDWLLNFLSSDGLQLVRPFLLECPTRDVRVNFASLINHSFHSYDIHHGDTETDHINRVLSAIVTLIEKDVPNNSKNSGQFFWLLSKFAQMVSVHFHQTSLHLSVILVSFRDLARAISCSNSMCSPRSSASCWALRLTPEKTLIRRSIVEDGHQCKQRNLESCTRSYPTSSSRVTPRAGRTPTKEVTLT